MKRHFRGGLVGLAGGVSWGGYPAAGCLRQRRHGGTNRYPFAGADQDWSGTCCERPNLGCARTAKGGHGRQSPHGFPDRGLPGGGRIGRKERPVLPSFWPGAAGGLNFFAGLCPPCRAEMPDLQAVSAQYQGRAILFGLDIGPFVGLGSRQDGKELVQELGVTYPTGTTFDSKVVREYRVLGMPTTVFLTPDGKVVTTWTGLLTRGKMVELFDQLLKASRE